MQNVTEVRKKAGEPTAVANATPASSVFPRWPQKIMLTKPIRKVIKRAKYWFKTQKCNIVVFSDVTKESTTETVNVPPNDVRMWPPWRYAINLNCCKLMWNLPSHDILRSGQVEGSKAGMLSCLYHLLPNHVSTFCLTWRLKYSCGKLKSPVCKSQAGALIDVYSYFYENRSRLGLWKLNHSYCTSSIDFY